MPPIAATFHTKAKVRDVNAQTDVNYAEYKKGLRYEI